MLACQRQGVGSRAGGREAEVNWNLRANSAAAINQVVDHRVDPAAASVSPISPPVDHSTPLPIRFGEWFGLY